MCAHWGSTAYTPFRTLPFNAHGFVVGRYWKVYGGVSPVAALAYDGAARSFVVCLMAIDGIQGSMIVDCILWPVMVSHGHMVLVSHAP